MASFLCEICNRSFRDDKHVHCGTCHGDLETIHQVRRLLARYVPRLHLMGTLHAARWALGHLLRRAESWEKNLRS